MFADSLLNLLARRRKLMEISIFFIVFPFLKEKMNYAKKEKKNTCLHFICHLYTNKVLIKIRFGGSD